jgi:WD40 repeat protein
MIDHSGKLIDRYKIVEELGQGGMAVVFRAYDTELDRNVAIKFIRVDNVPPKQHGRLLERFKREARAQAQFSHPNIVPVHAFGEHDSRPYLVMEYLKGETLKARIGEPVPFREAAELLAPIANALAYAHAQGVVHRDVKPSNILLTEKPMLTDFGIAKLLETEEIALTDTGIGVGTPEYMAPEQWQGQAIPQSDIYALGAVFYELVTGHKPYTADTPTAIAVKQMTQPLPRPSRYVPEIPQVVEEVIVKALALEPEERFENMKEFAVVLKQLAKGGQAHEIEKNIAQKLLLDRIQSEEFIEEVIEKGARSKKRIWIGVTGFILMAIVVGGLVFRKDASPLSIFMRGTETLIPSPTGTLTLTVTQIPTPENTKTPTQTDMPTQTPAPTPKPLIVISPDNVVNLEPIGTLGRGSLTSIAYSPNGEYLAASAGSGIFLYNTDDNQLVHVINTNSWAQEIIFSPEGDLLVSGNRDGTITFWDVEHVQLLNTIKAHDVYITTIDISVNGTLLASGDAAGLIKIWQLGDSALVKILEGHSAMINSVAFSMDETRLVSGSNDGSLRQWNISDGEQLYVLPGQHAWFDAFNRYDYVSSIAFSPTGELFASAGANEYVKVWRTSDSSFLMLLGHPSKGISSVAFSPTGEYVAGYGGNVISIWRVKDGIRETMLEVTNSYQDLSKQISFSPNGLLLATLTGKTTVNLWSVKRGDKEAVLSGYDSDISSLSFSPDSSSFVAAYGDNTLKAWNIENNTLAFTLSGHTDLVDDVIYSPSGDLIASASRDETVKIWRARDGLLLHTLTHPYPVNSIAFLQDGHRLAARSAIGTQGNWLSAIYLWQVDAGTLLNVFEQRVSKILYSHSENLLVGWNQNGITLWALPDFKIVTNFSVATTPYLFLQYDYVTVSENSDLLAVISSNSTSPIRTYSITDLESISSFGEAENYDYRGIAVSPDGKLIALLSHNLQFWNVVDGELIHEIGFSNSRNLTLSPDGKLLATGEGDGTITLWGTR